jgi:hypothetical protein
MVFAVKIYGRLAHVVFIVQKKVCPAAAIVTNMALIQTIGRDPVRKCRMASSRFQIFDLFYGTCKILFVIVILHWSENFFWHGSTSLTTKKPPVVRGLT